MFQRIVNKLSLDHFAISVDRVWLWIALIASAIIASLIPIIPNDFWWHLAIGKLIYTNHAIPSTNLFAWTLPLEHPFIYGEWLSELFLYVLYSLGKLPLIIIFHTFVVVIMFALVGYETIRRTGSWRIAGLMTILALCISIANLQYRPQMFIYLLFMGTFILLSSYSDDRLPQAWLLTVPLLIALWVNLHGSFILGIGLLSIYFVGEGIRTYLGLQGHLSREKVLYIGFVLAISLIVSLANPRFIGIYLYVKNIITDPAIQKIALEWQPPTPENFFSITFFVSILLLLLVLAYSRYRLTPTEFLLTIAFLWLGWSSIRNMVWYSMVVMPITGKVIYHWIGDKPWMAIPKGNLLNSFFIFLMAISIGLFQPNIIDKLPLPSSHWQAVLRESYEGPMVATNTPLGAVNYLREHPGGKLFNDVSFGSYLIWALPDQKVFIDTRIELYPYRQWSDYINIMNGVNYNKLLHQYGADRLLLSATEQQNLISYLEEDPSWKIEYKDQFTQLWKKSP